MLTEIKFSGIDRARLCYVWNGATEKRTFEWRHPLDLTENLVDQNSCVV